MYKDYYNKITDASQNPDNTKGIHVKTFSARNQYDCDKQTQEFLNLMIERHGDNFKIMSMSNPMNMNGFSNQIMYSIS